MFLPEPGGLAVIGFEDAEVGRRAWPADAVPLGLAAWPGRPLGSAQVFATLQTADGCRIEGLDEAARLIWSTELGPCHPASTAGGRLLVASGARVFALDPEAGEAQPAVALPEPATTSVVYGGLDENGGSHWYVGLAAAVLELVAAGDELAVGGRAALDLAPTDLAVAGTVGVALGAGQPPTRAQALGLEPAPRVAGPVIPLPGGVHTAPLVLPPCDGRDANGGSHWWCGGGALVAGGDGWLGAWRLLDGEPFFLENQEDPAIRVSGLAAGRDGRIYNGGSHWRAGGWQLRASDPEGGVLLLAGQSAPGTCVGSPLLDTAGTLWAPLSTGGVIHAATGAGGLAAAWARQGGDAAGSGTAPTVGASCPAGDVPLFVRPTDEAVLPAVAGAVADDLLVAGRRADTGALWATRLAADGAVRWSRSYADAALDPGLPPLAVGALAGGGAVVVQALPDFMRLLRLTPAGDILADLRIGSRIPHVARAASILPQGGGAVVGTLPAAAAGEPDHWLFPLDADGVQGQELSLTDSGGPFTPSHVAVGPLGYVLAGIGREGLVVRGITAGGVERWRVPLVDQAGVAGLAVDAAGEAIVLTGPLGQDAAALTLIDPVGVPRSGAGIPEALPAALALDPAGGGAVLTKDFLVYPLSAAGALDPPARLAPDVRGLAVVAVAGGFFALGQPIEEGATGATFARADGEGRAACEAAGRCLSACPAGDACARATCEPATGACGLAPRDDGQPCGVGLVCQAGACGR
ncbi:MAG: hypothetical protein R3F60_20790 [bacterium]